MKVTVKMPRAADTVDEVVVSEWVAAEGSPVSEGDPLIRVETDKAMVDVPAPVSGTLVTQLVAVDDEITTGTAIAVIESK
jgi:pyruvate/2-oxoglutarate dehydrogenase complex dihydrolipoamide acyltransferase (E2) component